MLTVQTEKELDINDVRAALVSELSANYKVTVASPSTLKVGRSGVMPSKVTMSRQGNTTTFKIAAAGLFVSRIVQAASINPRIKRILEARYAEHVSP